MDRQIFDYDPTKGCAFQGDVSIIPIPASLKIDRSDEILPINNRLILQEGEITGHHHAIALMEREPQAPRNREADRLMSDTLAGKIAVPTAKTYRDPKAVEAMVRLGILTRADLAVCVLVIEVGAMCLQHEEHDGIRIPPGNYLVGRQVESAGAEERMVAD